MRSHCSVITPHRKPVVLHRFLSAPRLSLLSGPCTLLNSCGSVGIGNQSSSLIRLSLCQLLVVLVSVTSANPSRAIGSWSFYLALKMSSYCAASTTVSWYTPLKSPKFQEFTQKKTTLLFTIVARVSLQVYVEDFWWHKKKRIREICQSGDDNSLPPLLKFGLRKFNLIFMFALTS